MEKIKNSDDKDFYELSSIIKNTLPEFKKGLEEREKRIQRGTKSLQKKISRAQTLLDKTPESIQRLIKKICISKDETRFAEKERQLAWKKMQFTVSDDSLVSNEKKQDFIDKFLERYVTDPEVYLGIFEENNFLRWGEKKIKFVDSGEMIIRDLMQTICTQALQKDETASAYKIICSYLVAEAIAHIDPILTTEPFCRSNTSDALVILSFADKDQQIDSILTEYYSTEDRSLKRRTIFCIKVLEKSLGVEFGKNNDDDDKIIALFFERLLRRSFHGTTKASARNMLQNGITYKGELKGHNYTELTALINDGLWTSCYFESHQKKGKSDASAFYVCDDPSIAIDYSMMRCPEWFSKMYKYGSKQGKFDEEFFKINFCRDFPKCKDIARVVRFVKQQWNTCVSNSKNTAVVIVERDEESILRRLISCLQPTTQELEIDSAENFFSSWLSSLTNWFSKPPSNKQSSVQKPYSKEMIYKDFFLSLKSEWPKSSSFDTLEMAMVAFRQQIDVRLDEIESPQPPEVVKAVKIGISQ